MIWRSKSTRLEERLQDLQKELEQEQGKAARLASVIARLQSFAVSPTGQVPCQAFAEALVDAMHSLFKVEQAALLEMDANTLELVPSAARGFTPDFLTRWRVRMTDRSMGVEGPRLAVPLLSKGQTIGSLLVVKPRAGSFSAEDRGLFSLLAAQTVLVMENHRHFHKLERTREQSVEALSRALAARDLTTQRHTDRTRALVSAMARELALPDILLQQIEDGAFLHDIGKIGIDDAILKKPGELTPTEYAVMKTHCVIGKQILDPFPTLHAVAAIVLYHQEWYNGAGYPEGLAGEEIPLGARIVQILDAWDAMTSDRIYRSAMTQAAAVTELRRQSGSQFDPKLVDVFLRVQDRMEREGISTTEKK